MKAIQHLRKKNTVPKKRLIVVEDEPVVRDGLEYIINQSKEYECIGAFPSAEDALDVIDTLDPEIVLTDIGLPGMDGISFLREVKKSHPECSVVMLTIFEDDDRVMKSIMAGADGYLLKKTPPNKIASALNELNDGGAPMSTQIAKKVLEVFRVAPAQDHTASLSEREVEILEQLVKGYTSKQIAEKLFISSETVRGHLKNIYQKLHVHSKTEAVAKVLKSKSFSLS